MNELLSQVGQRIIDQDGRITAEPLFAVMQKREIVVSEDYGHDRIVWVHDEGGEADDDIAGRLDDLRDDVDSDHWDEDEIELDGVEWRRLAVKDLDEFVTACFTEHGCKEYLNVNGHNLRRPFIYVFSGNRNAEFIALRHLMIDSAKEGKS